MKIKKEKDVRDKRKLITPRICKYCDKPAKIVYTGIKRRHKGYCRTCGSPECLKQQYLDHAVNQKKRYKARNITARCKSCGGSFVKEHYYQKWCKSCVPDASARAIMMRYGISKSEHNQLLVTNSGLCWICLKRKAKVVDHCHKTGKIRGLLCNHCNTSLHLVENTEALERAIKYVSISK